MLSLKPDFRSLTTLFDFNDQTQVKQIPEDQKNK